MLLTRRSTPTAAPAAGVASSSLVSSLARGLQRAIPTLDRRSFLRRSGLGVGAGLAASQLTLVKRADASESARTALTDGVTLAGPGPRFPHGALYALHADTAVAAFDLGQIATALQLAPACRS